MVKNQAIHGLPDGFKNNIQIYFVKAFDMRYYQKVQLKKRLIVVSRTFSLEYQTTLISKLCRLRRISIFLLTINTRKKKTHQHKRINILVTIKINKSLNNNEKGT